MVTMKHTPGPWEACDGASVTVNEMPVVVPDHVCRRFRDEHGRRVTQFVSDCNAALPESSANARLIAAAPEMLALLEESQRNLTGDWRERRDALLERLNWDEE